MSLAGRLCLVVLLLWQGVLLAQGVEVVAAAVTQSAGARQFAFDRLRGSYSGESRQGITRIAPANKSLLELDGRSTSTAQPRQSRLRPRLFWSAGLALAAGGTAWWSARKADRAYARYLHSASLVRQQDQMRRARQYDRIAGGALALMEAGIVFTTYLVFF